MYSSNQIFEKHVKYIFDLNGKIIYVQIPYEEWIENQNKPLEPITKTYSKDSEEFKVFMKSWTYNYDFPKQFECKKCASCSLQFLEDDKFILLDINLGGLLKVKCRNCGNIYTLKFFKRKLEIS